jgi:hypothetical protein
MMSRPAALSSAARVVTAMVGDGLMRPKRWARTAMTKTPKKRGKQRPDHSPRRLWAASRLPCAPGRSCLQKSHFCPYFTLPPPDALGAIEVETDRGRP